MREKQTNLKSNKAITIIALVITIIVLLILAGVTIQTLTGNNGLLTKAKYAVDKNTDGEIEEQIKLAYSEFQMNNFFRTSENLENFIKNKLENFYPEAIINCSGKNLIEISVEKNSNKYEYFLNNDGNVVNKNNVEIIDFTLTNENYEMAGIKREGDIIIPDFFVNNGTYYKIISIGEKAFQNCKKIGKVQIPDTVTSIGNYAFNGSTVTDVGIPKNVTNIGNYAFSSCVKFKVADFPKVKSIGTGAFWYMSLSSINFPEADDIGYAAFQYGGTRENVFS